MVTKKDRIAIIPARGGSKRISNKNIIDFQGKPLIAWTIEAALQSQMFDKIIVSTDSMQIAEVAEKYGAVVPFLREQYADDFSPVSAVIVDALEKIAPHSYKVVAQLMPNCPLRDAKDIQNALSFFETNSFDFQISMFPFGWINPWWAYKIESKSKPIPLFSDDLRNRRSQDQEPLYCPTGAIWIAKTDKLMIERSFYGKDFQSYIMNWQNAVDIDNYEDLEMAEALFLLKQKRQ
ncbi:MAG: acylneuraminate cytidylyltransferase family protein [Bernardetiaceae bacterium]|nr:acylneuraminate cytidylyltransferase family protein [Bernardetiaceae bacterium]